MLNRTVRRLTASASPLGRCLGADRAPSGCCTGVAPKQPHQLHFIRSRQLHQGRSHGGDSGHYQSSSHLRANSQADFDTFEDEYDSDEDDNQYDEEDGIEISYPEPSAQIGHWAPEFSAPAVIDGEISQVSLNDYRGKWTVLLFYPKDFTFVCPTEIIAFSDRHAEFEKLNAQVLALSTDTEECHLAWTRLPRKKGGLGHMQIPLVADTTKIISAKYGVLLQKAGIALRGLFIINPEGKLEQITINNLGIGRSVEEALRLLQAYQFVAEHGEVCPADWKPGERSMKADAKGSLEYFSANDERQEKEWQDEEDDPLQAGPRVKVIRTPKDYRAVTAKGKVVVDFVAPWCGKCRQIMPYVNQLSEEHKGVTFAKVDTTVDALQSLQDEVNVNTLPAFHFFKDGKPVGEPVYGYKKRPLKEQVEKLESS